MPWTVLGICVGGCAAVAVAVTVFHVKQQVGTESGTP